MSTGPSGQSQPQSQAIPKVDEVVEEESLLESILKGTRLERATQKPEAAQRQRIEAEQGLRELAKLIESGKLSLLHANDLPRMISEGIAQIDDQISDQLDAVIHHDKFKKLEASWRGLHRLVQQANNRSETGEDIQIKVLNTSRRELERDLRVGTEISPIQSGLFEKVHRNAFDMYGGIPFAALVGDFEFSHEAQDVDFLKKISGVAAVAHAPFIASAGAAMFGWKDFTDLANAGDLAQQFNLPEYDNWRAFRRNPDSKYAALCLPHVLARLPYGQGGEAVESFRYKEGVDGRDHDRYLWGNAAFSFAGRLVESFARDGWCVSITGPKGGGLVDDLPLHSFKTDQGVVANKCPTEVQISGDRDFALTKLGFIPLVHRMNDKYAVFNGAPSCYLPEKYTTPEGNANAFMAAQLPYLMAASRIAHYLKLIGREEVGSAKSADECRYELQSWINNYVIDQDDATEEQRRRKPLRQATIEVFENAARPGFYSARAYITPHIKLEGLSVTVSLVADLPHQRDK